MSLDSIKRNRAAIIQLKRAVLEETISHAYLFVGEEAVRKEFSMEFAKAILCTNSLDDNCGKCVICRKIEHSNHEDVFFIDKDGNSIKTEAIETLISSISYKSIGKRTVIVMDHADTMTDSAQNKLLKTLEEPLGNTVIILLAERKHALRDTVISRCVSFYLQDGVISPDPQLSALALDFIHLSASGMPYYKKRDVLEEILADRNRCLNFLDVLEEEFRSWLFVAAKTPMCSFENEKLNFFEELPHTDVTFIQKSVKELENARKAIQHSYNVSYALKCLCLQLDNRRLMEELIW
ncbi:MAG: AAA family ATPase [Clostridia bacterium]|nr:AAA family ATPase [Clostridia bacterium]